MNGRVLSCLIISLVFGTTNGMAQAEPVAGTPEFNKAVHEEFERIMNRWNPVDQLKLMENKNIALEIADKHPYAAFFFAGIYATSTQGMPIMAKSPRGGNGVYDPTLTSERVKELINKYHNGEVMEKIKPNKELQTRFIMDYELVETADGAGYLTFESALADKHNKEIEKISPNIRVQLKRIEDEKGEKWEPVGWQTY